MSRKPPPGEPAASGAGIATSVARMTSVARLLVPVLCAALPPASALVYLHRREARDGRDRLEREVLAQAQLVAVEVGGVLEGARRFLHGEARAGRAGAAGCGETLARLDAAAGDYAFVLVLDAGGRPVCGGLPGDAGRPDGAAAPSGTAVETAPGAIADSVRHAAAEAARHRRFAVGRFGPAGGGVGPYLPVALPAPPRGASGGPHPGGDHPGVFVLGLKLDRLGERVAALPRPFGAAALVADRDGTVLARAPGAGVRPGQALGGGWAGVLRSAGPGATGVPDAAGGTRLVGHVPIGEAPSRLFAAAEAPPAPDPAARHDAPLAAACVLLGLGLASWSAHRLIRAPLLDLLSAARRRAAGDPAARARPRAGPDTEFGQLARAFNALADADAERAAQVRRLTATLEARVQERTRALREANRRLRAQAAERETASAGQAQARKLRAVGQLAGGVAHEFNNLLTGVLGSLELLQQRTPDEARDQRRLIGRALDAVQRGGWLTSQLLHFSRKQSLDPRPTDLNDAIRGMARTLSAALGAGIRLDLRLEPRPWPAWVDRDGFEAAVLGLALNARDAMSGGPLGPTPGGGRLLVSTANRTVGPDDAWGELRPGDYVAVSVSDTGAGMTVETLSRAFEPFFTTKPPGKGAGLGLSQVHGLVERSGGDVRIVSRPGRGTRVTVLLPRAPADAAPDPPEAAGSIHAPPRAGSAPPRPGEAGEIVLVDDDDAVRDVTAMLLAEAGHRVHSAADAQEALRLLAKHGDAVRVLVADYAMPGMDGLELIALVRREWPGIAALLATGGADPPGPRDRGPTGPDGVVHKPYRGRELVARIREVMQERRARDVRVHDGGAA